MAYKNYKPKANKITVGSLAGRGGMTFTQSIATENWSLFLLEGIAKGPSGTTLASGAVQIWESGTLTTAAPNHTTYTDSVGKYGVTCKIVGLTIKFYSK